ncbi:MAG: glutathione S-transferase family protein [Hyphomicrobiaceae bacterium]|nr:glutathione S-transferase family protein [Hyphomicrobiaceae bacterium]
MARTTLYGFRRSVYVRIVRLALAEKRIAYDLVEIDPFAAEGLSADYLGRHPFGRIPAFEHDGFRLYETGAIARYIDEAFSGAALQPKAPRERARMNQVISILDSYAYRPLVWDIFVARSRPNPDEGAIALAATRADACFAALEDLMGDAPFLAGSALTLADLHAAPMIAYVRRTPEGEALLKKHKPIARWWQAMDARPSMAATRFPVEEGP